MELTNHTTFPAQLFRTIIKDDVIAASLMARVSFDCEGNEVKVSKNQDWPVSNKPWISVYGPMCDDNIFMRGGVDIFVFGNAKTPGGIPAKQMEVKVFINNSMINSLLVFGNRIWKNDIIGYSIQGPELFTEMPLTLENSYGGYDEWDGLKVPFPNNAYGKGFIWKKENTIGKALPNLEDPKNLIRKWNDQPDPVGLCHCPMSELKARGNIEKNSKGLITNILPKFYNAAFPSMIVDTVKPGDIIKVEGLTHNGTYEFRIPSFELGAKIEIGESKDEKLLMIDQVGIIPEKQQAFISYRFPFRYKIRPMETRICELININQ
jgi:hypothetical protein